MPISISNMVTSLALTLFTVCLLVQTFTMLLECTTVTIFNHIAIWGTVIFFLCFTWALISLPYRHRVHELAVFQLLARDPVFWLRVAVRASCLTEMPAITFTCFFTIYLLIFPAGRRCMYLPRCGHQILLVLVSSVPDTNTTVSGITIGFATCRRGICSSSCRFNLLKKNRL